MKKYLVLLLFITTSGFAQENKKFEKAMEKNLTLLKDAKTGEDYTNAANAFERIAKAETKEWLPSYYEAFALILSANDVSDAAKKDAVLDKAMEVAKAAEAISPDNSEIVTLQSWITSMKISVDPMNRGQKLGMEASVLTSRAIELDPENPRPYLLQGTGLFYTPEQFGGGKDKAQKVLEKAVEKFNSFKPKNKLMPNWGKERAMSLLEECKK
ncbi:MAG TPA: hypothetical protein PKN14_06965 [Bacteroidia bacterium]|nr:hypothetical protein [Bacteroidia bacterium]MBX3106614.1 hypothetical protein [Bacteroidota bacterium]MCE7955546.1 hypothetical protein [Bacteroidetes bacterium CHB6]OQB62094.1 MAG: hypothetical protein BWX95_01620 [Bacteroidetes bacterium ADurb.Bin141]MCB0848894.1 hypothetical protein [Bacteroidota bacterium]